MTTATDLAMNLADVRLRIRQLTDGFIGNDWHFDQGVKEALTGLTQAIAQSAEAVHFDSSKNRRQSKVSDEYRHEKWQQRQEINRVRSRLNQRAKSGNLLERSDHQ